MSILRKLRCALFGHRFRVHQAFTSYSRRVVCDRCPGDWAMHDCTRSFVRWGSDFEQLYIVMGHEVRPVPQRGTKTISRASA